MRGLPQGSAYFRAFQVDRYLIGKLRKRRGICKTQAVMEDLEDSEIQFSQWTDSLDDQLMETEDPLTQENIQLNTTRVLEREKERNAITRGTFA